MVTLKELVLTSIEELKKEGGKNLAIASPLNFETDRKITVYSIWANQVPINSPHPFIEILDGMLLNLRR